MITKIELMNQIVAATETVPAEWVEYAQHQIELDVAAKEKAKEKRANADPTESEAYQANLPLIESVRAHIAENGAKTTAEVATYLTETLGYEVKSPKASAVCRQGVKMGVFTVADVKIKGGNRKSYSIAE